MTIRAARQLPEGLKEYPAITMLPKLKLHGKQLIAGRKTKQARAQGIARNAQASADTN